MKTGCLQLDELIQKANNEITLVYGPASSGKTTLAKLSAIQLLIENKKVLFIDTENGFSVERFLQLSGNEKLLKNIIMLKPKNFYGQYKAIQSLEKTADKFSLIIIDTIGIFYRKELKKNQYLANKVLDKQFQILKEISKKIPVLITNQVYINLNDNKINNVGGEMVKNWANCLIELKIKPRRIKIEKPFEFESKLVINNKSIILI
ncbi:AAA family ATPase [Candidatus Woesearchaeota archaeon]|nr:AAA family ATPase [Candidatus Woesearchaeota archaeon]